MVFGKIFQLWQKVKSIRKSCNTEKKDLTEHEKNSDTPKIDQISDQIEEHQQRFDIDQENFIGDEIDQESFTDDEIDQEDFTDDEIDNTDTALFIDSEKWIGKYENGQKHGHVDIYMKWDNIYSDWVTKEYGIRKWEKLEWTLKFSGNFKNNKKNGYGTEYQYCLNKKTWSECNYIDDKLHGLQKYFSHEGYLYQTNQMKNGKCFFITTYHNNGKLKGIDYSRLKVSDSLCYIRFLENGGIKTLEFKKGMKKVIL